VDDDVSHVCVSVGVEEGVMFHATRAYISSVNTFPSVSLSFTSTPLPRRNEGRPCIIVVVAVVAVAAILVVVTQGQVVLLCGSHHHAFIISIHHHQSSVTQSLLKAIQSSSD
jgi:hypothetical protein